jgi:hypothetical protein
VRSNARDEIIMTDRDRDAPQENLARADGLWTALGLFVAVLFFLGLAAYLYWSGTGKLPWS